MSTLATIKTGQGPLVVILADWECWGCGTTVSLYNLGERGLCPRCDDITPRHITLDSTDEELNS